MPSDEELAAMDPKDALAAIMGSFDAPAPPAAPGGGGRSADDLGFDFPDA
jgi:hypothetical protein